MKSEKINMTPEICAGHVITTDELGHRKSPHRLITSFEVISLIG